MKLVLLRHTEIENPDSLDLSWTDVGLSAEGKRQAEKLASPLSKYNFDVIFISPLRRTRETIEPYLSTLDHPSVVTDKRIIERNLGKFTAAPTGTFRKYCEDNGLDRVTTRPEGGESNVDVFERAKKFLAYLQEHYTDKVVLVSSHKNFLRNLELAITHEPIEKFYESEHPKHGEIREFDL